VSFVLGATVALALQYVSYRFTQRREYWIRRLNSYQDFCHHSAQLIDLLIAEVDVPKDRRWAAVADARKAAYDARYYDPDAPDRWTEMQQITLEMAVLAEGQRQDPRALTELKDRIDAFRVDAQRRDPQLRRLSGRYRGLPRGA
jgi:hypothetical protein